MTILFGKDPASRIYNELNLSFFKIKPKFCIIQIGNNSASNLYIKFKINIAKMLNFDFIYKKFQEDISLDQLKEIINEINNDKTVNGIIVQLPLPDHLLSIIEYIAPEKDIDGLTKFQQARLYDNQDGLYPCTALGVIKLLEYYKIPVENKKITVLGRSNLVGKPLAMLLLHNNALVSLIHSKISIDNIRKELQSSDIVCSAIGSPLFIKLDMIKNGVTLIDIGCGTYNGKIKGDIDQECYAKSSAYTPMPNGVGPMTIASLMFNIHKAYKIQNQF